MSYPAYAETKPSEVEWLGDVPHNWSVKRTRYICNLNPSKSEVSRLPPETPVSFLPMEKVGTEGEMLLDENRALEDVLQGFTYFRDGDIITAKITPCFENGKGAVVSHLTNSIGFGSTEFHVLRPFRYNVPRFIYYLTKSHGFRSLGTASMYGAGGQKRVPEDFLEDFRIAFPPENEQQQIAAFLDRKTAQIDAVLAQKERQLGLLAEKRQVLISQAVTRGLDPTAPLKHSGIPWLGDVPEHWEVLKLAWLFQTIGSGTTPNSNDESFYDGETPWINTGELNDNIISETKKSVTKKAMRQLSALTLFPAGTLLIALYGATIGKLGILGIPATTNQACCALAHPKGITVDFAFYWFIGNRRHIISMAYGGGQPNISQELVKQLRFALPPLHEQATIVAYLDRETARMDGIAQAIRVQREKVREYRQALISAAVTGKIDVRER